MASQAIGLLFSVLLGVLIAGAGAAIGIAGAEVYRLVRRLSRHEVSPLVQVPERRVFLRGGQAEVRTVIDVKEVQRVAAD